MQPNMTPSMPPVRPPRVSVVVPNYNHERYLAQRIDSVLGQTFQDMEVIILDDASCDGSLAVINRYAADPRVRIFVNTVNSGNACRQWNRGVREARGEYVWIAESDDYADARLLETLVARLDARPGAGLAYCDSVRVDAAGVPLGECKEFNEQIEPGRWKADFEAEGREQVRRSLVLYNSIPNASAVLLRRSVYERAGGAVETLRLCGDWMTWIHMLMISDLVYVAEPMNFFRWHSGSVRALSGDLALCLEHYTVLACVPPHLALEAPRRRRVCNRLAAAWACALLEAPSWQAWRHSRDVFRAAVRYDPLAFPRLVLQLGLYYPRRLRDRLGGRGARAR